MSLQEIVNVNITRETTAVARTGFGIVMILGVHRRTAEVIKFYSSITAVAADFATTDLEYIAANEVFAQNPVVTQIAIGRRKNQDTTVVTVTPVDDTVYSTIINGTTFTITSDSDATAIEIAAALKVVIDLGSEPVTITDNADGTYDIDPTVAETGYSVTVDSNQATDALVPAATLAADLTAIVNSNNTWYGLTYTLRTQADVEAIAAWTESNKKLFGTTSATAAVVDTTDAADTTTVAAVLKAAAYTRSFVMYHALAATRFPECALFGNLLPRTPGSYTAMFKTLAGIAVSALTDTQSTNARDKYVMVYELIGGVNMTREGKVAEGEYIDIIVLVDWTDSNITENIFARMVNLAKVPFTDAGIAIVEAEIKGVYDEGVANGGFTSDPAAVISVPKAADVSTANKTNRLLPDVTFTFTLAGAIHATTINGVVTL